MTPSEFTAARQDLGVSQAELARLLGMADRGAVWKYEAGQRNPSRQVTLLMEAMATGWRPCQSKIPNSKGMQE